LSDIDLSFAAWVRISPQFVSGYVLRKRIGSSAESQALSCWGWFISGVFGVCRAAAYLGERGAVRRWKRFISAVMFTAGSCHQGKSLSSDHPFNFFSFFSKCAAQAGQQFHFGAHDFSPFAVSASSRSDPSSALHSDLQTIVGPEVFLSF